MAEYRKTIPVPRSPRRTWQDRLLQAMVLAALFGAAAALIYAPFLVRNTGQIRSGFFVIPYLVGLVTLACGLWVFAARRYHPGGRAFALFAASTSVMAALLFNFAGERSLIILLPLALSAAGASILDFALRYPSDDPILYQFPPLKWLAYAVFGLLGAYALRQLSQLDGPGLPIAAWLLVGFSIAALAFSMLWMAVRQSKTAERDPARLAWMSGTAGFSPAVLWLAAALVIPGLAFTPILLLPAVLFPLSVAYGVQRYRQVHTDYMLNRMVLYGLLAVLVSVGYALLASGLGVLLGGVIGNNLPLLSGVAFFLVAMAIYPLRQYLENQINRVFFRGELAYQERMQDYSRELTGALEVGEIVSALRNAIQNSAAPEQMHIFLYDALSEQYSAAPGENRRRTSDLRFPPSSALVVALQKQSSSLFLKDFEALPADLRVEKFRLTLLGAQLFVPLPARQRLSGWVALGPRKTGNAYAARDMEFLESLCDQAAVAIERSQVLVNMENRVREMNVLARVAQGINITLSLDDILELIYAQTSQVVPSDDFHILLGDGAAGSLEEIFYVENNERLLQCENQPLTGPSLEHEVVRQRRSILADDYGRECQQRGVAAVKTGLHAWMGVPLNAGAETIGAVCLAMREPSVTYAREQLNLLQSIADQVAGALVKARLLEETERRNRQLASLNEVTRQLTSTLELSPLLRNILQSAVDILECEAGSLLLVDPQTGDLVFQATAGAAPADLEGRRLPPGTGLVGESINTRRALTRNNAAETPEWYASAGEGDGFAVRSLMTVPLLAKDSATGVIEVVNKRDGSAFKGDEQDLLAAFAAQAAVAIENARLYMLTDQALAARVEELSVMQRIDRELNASLDASRAMRITLEWAMRQSGASAGLVGMIKPEGLQVMAHQGYSDELAPYDDSPLSLEEYHLLETVQSGAPQSFLTGENGYKALWKRARTQTMIPIRREASTMGLVLLESESVERCTVDALNFLTRLSDHAAIAISNAQLYSAVQQANVAKSEFVSFVSHELKNPMTSIKGYTELIAAGAVGPVSDAQANFLATIRSNVERMSTLVSDLADVSRIEAGRLKLDFKAFAIKEVVEEVSRSMRRQIEEKRQQVNIQLPEELPSIWADRTRILQIVTNLVSNAYKYTPAEGCITVAAEACDNRWDDEGAPKVVHFWVQDTGIGIGPEDQAKIFQKFFRSEDPKTREVTGTGLGLNITKSLVEMQGGRIWFDSELRKGTTFHFTAPVAE